MTNSHGPLLLSVPDLAAALSISRASIYKLLASGKVGPEPVHLTPGRVLFCEAEVRAWVLSGCPNRQAWLSMKEGKP